MKSKQSIVIMAFITVSLLSCNDNKATIMNTPESAISESISIENSVKLSENGLTILMNEATKYNSLYADEAKASLSEQNPMPNIHQNVDTLNKMYIFDYIWNERLGHIEKINHKNGMKGVLNTISNNPQALNFMKILAEEGYGIRFNIEGSISGKKVSNEVSVNEIKELISLTN